MAGMSSAFAALPLLLLLTVSFLHSSTFYHVAAEEQQQEPADMKLLMTHQLKSKLLQVPGRGRSLRSFQICALCTCCGGPRGLCLPSPCCYAINCNIPNRPFGFCAFTPKSCNCFGCYL